MEKHPLHLKTPELQKSEEVANAVAKQERLTDEKAPNEPGARIEAYMDRLENVFLHPDEAKRERNIEMLRDKIYDALIIKPENFPESYFELQQRVARERGQAVENIPSEVREQMIQTAIEDQKHSLDQWIDYLSSNDAVYPPWFKYYVWKNITKLSQFDKARGEFKQRTQSTVAPYPDIYREPLAQIADAYQKVKEDNKNLKDEEVQAIFAKKFPTVYAELIQKSLAAQIENQEEIKGEWVKYEKGKSGEAEKLYQSLENKGTGWCTAGHDTAKTQVNSGDFYVYYTNDKDGNPTQPRLAIRMDGNNQIGEVRGILPQQGVEPQLQETLDTKLKDFGPEADKYQKKSADMKRLTEIDQKTKQGEVLTKSDLEFLYELNGPIEGFGYDKDPRIAEIRSKRNQPEDLPVIFECAPDQIAYTPENLKPDTVAYIGKWNPSVLKVLPENVKYIYEKFPEQKVFLRTIEIDPTIQSAEDAEKAILVKGDEISDHAKSMLKSVEFGKEATKYKLASFSVADLGFPKGATKQQIDDKAIKLGLELCPAEVGPHLRLQYADQPNGEFLVMAMKAISDPDGRANVWLVDRDGDPPWLNGSDGHSGIRWDAGYRFVFLCRE